MESLQQPDGHIRWKREPGHERDLDDRLRGPAPLPARPGRFPSRRCRTTRSSCRTIGRGRRHPVRQRRDRRRWRQGRALFSRPKPQSRAGRPAARGCVRAAGQGPVDHSETQARRERQAARDRQFRVTGERGERSRRGTGCAGGGRPAPRPEGARRRYRGDAPGAGRSGGSAAAELAASAGRRRSRARGHRHLVGAPAARAGSLAFGAPGLHSAGVDAGGSPWPAIAIAAAAVLLGLAGSQLERRRWEAPRVSAAIDLGDALAEIATALRVPVLIAAVLVLLLCALELGRFGAELWRRRVRARHVDLARADRAGDRRPRARLALRLQRPGRDRRRGA